MADLNSLSQSGLAALLQQDPKAYEDMLFGQAETDIQRQGTSRAQQINENAFGRGLGLSTINAYSQAENKRAQDEAIAKARVDASTAARQAQLSALAQAAGVAQNDANRAQQESQFGRAMKNQRNIAGDQMLAGGLTALGGAGLGLGMKAFGPEAINGIRGLAGMKPMYNTGGPSGPGGMVQSPGEAMTNPALSFGAGDAIDFSMPDVGGGGALTDFLSSGSGGFDLGGDFGGGGFDFGALDALDPSMFSFGLSPLDFMVDPNWDFSF